MPKCKLSKKGTEGYHTAGGDGVVLERGQEYDLSAEQIEALGDQVEVEIKPRGRKAKAKRR